MEYLCQWPSLTRSGTGTLPAPGAGREAPRGVAEICQRDGGVAAVPLVRDTSGGMHGPEGPARPSADPHHPRCGRDVTLPRDGSEDTSTVPAGSARQQAGKALPRHLFVCRPHRAKRGAKTGAPAAVPPAQRCRLPATARGPGERRSAVPPSLSSLPSPQLRPGYRHTSAGQEGSAGGQRPPRHHRDAARPP